MKTKIGGAFHSLLLKITQLAQGAVILVKVCQPMPVPDFNSSDVLPPHLGDPRLRSELSPFPATVLAICQKQKLSNSDERRKILNGWIQLRDLLRQLG